MFQSVADGVAIGPSAGRTSSMTQIGSAVAACRVNKTGLASMRQILIVLK
jgi:hypothetical protein